MRAFAVILCSGVLAAPVSADALGQEIGVNWAQVRSDAPNCREAKIYAVESVMVTRVLDGLMLEIRATSSTAGWKTPRLIERSRTPDGSTVIFDLTGCAPEIAAQVMTPLAFRQTIPNDGRLLAILVRAKTNEQRVVVER